MPRKGLLPVLCETITAETAAERFRLAAEKHEAAKAATAAKAADDAGFDAYVATLPSEIAGFKRDRHEMTDDIGNYVLSIPKKAAREGWSVKTLAAYIDEQTAEGWGE